jgi:hypothetical protein
MSRRRPNRTAQPPVGTPIDRSHPLARGLVGLYAVNEGVGPTLFDATGTTGNLTLLNGFATGNPWTVAPPPYAGLGLANSGGVGATGRVTAVGAKATPLTLFAWSCALAGNNGSYRTAIALYDTAETTNFGVGWSGTTGTPILAVENAGFDALTGADVGVGKWALLTAVFASPTSRTLYVNGQQAGSSSAAMADPTAVAWTFVGDVSGSAAFLSVGLAGVYNRALSAAEVRRLYESPWSLFRPSRRRRRLAAAAAPRRPYSVLVRPWPVAWYDPDAVG